MSESEKQPAEQDPLAFVAGGGEMEERIHAFDWSRTPLGPAEAWSPALRTMVRLMLANRLPMLLWWGPQYVSIYNDPYRPVLGNKHPWGLGQPVSECWKEIWHVLRPLIDTPYHGGPATWDEDILLVINRHGFAEETHWLIAYSPVPDESVPGGIGGVLATVNEITEKVVGQRRMVALRDLGTRTAEARTAEAACAEAARTLGKHARDVPFALLYLADADGGHARLAGAAGVTPGEAISPQVIALGADDGGGWPLAAARRTGQAQVVADLGSRFAAVPPGPWPDPPTTAVVLPIPSNKPHDLAGFLVAGVSSRLRLDDAYRGFLDLAATQVATTVANARAYEEEKRRAEALAELDRAKTAFFSNVSHEFRTPLTLMLGPVEDLLARSHTDLPPAAARQLEVVSRNGLRLLRLVNTLLDFSRIEAGRVRAVYQPTDLAGFTAELASVFRSACERAGLRLLVECPKLAEPVYVDREMWEKVVLNLLSNAFKFTFEGEIAVSLRKAGSNVELLVRDTGIGIPPEEMPRLFERFHRVENAQGRTHEGSGIGLALVQELVKLHGGSVTVQSVVGTGTAFTVAVPLGSAHLPHDRIGASRDLAAATTGAAPYVEEALRWLPDEQRPEADLSDVLPGHHEFPPVACPHPEQGGDRPRVLVADDNADMRQYLVRLLAERYEVEAAADGQAALAAARERPPDLILTDVMMPRLDGFGLLREVRADARTSGVPVIMLSARAGEESRVEGMDAGADDYLVKPFGARELLARVGAHLQMARMRREADRRKDEFLATLAHELRNPLAPIRNALQVIRLSPDREAREQARTLMERQLDQMVRLVDDLMDVSRITRGKLELRREQVPLATVVASAVETSRPLIDHVGHELTLTLPKQAILVDADPTRLAQVFSNLLTNAAKYSDRGSRICLTAERRGSEAVVSVRDTGIGIAADQLPRIFEMFSQVDRSLERSQGGLGIGLTLVKRLVEMHGGTVEARSDGPGQGSEFVVRLPVAVQASGPQASGGDGEPAAVKSSLRILIVDDNRDGADSLGMMLRLLGHEIRTAYDGLEALDAAAAFRPDVILLDIGLPKLNGHEACRRLRGQPGGKELVIIAQTGWGQEEDRQRTQEAGFDHHMVKPVDPAVLMQLLAGLDRVKT